MTILVVGSVAYDDLETPFGQKERVLGGAATHFSASASFFAPVQLVGVVGGDFKLEELEFLKRRGVDLSGLQVQKNGKTFHWKGRYGYDLNDAETLKTDLNVFEKFNPVLPSSFLNAAYVFLANIDPVLQLRVLEQMKKPKLVALDTMNYWIQGKKKELLDTLKRVDILLINEAEIRQLAGERNLVKAAKRVRSWGPKVVVVKQGEYGALLLTDSFMFSAPAFPLEDLKDPTGAGDSFAGGFLGFLAKKGDGLNQSNLKQAVVCGSTMASFQVEEFGLERMILLTKEEIIHRFQAFKTLSHFEELLSV